MVLLILLMAALVQVASCTYYCYPLGHFDYMRKNGKSNPNMFLHCQGAINGLINMTPFMFPKAIEGVQLEYTRYFTLQPAASFTMAVGDCVAKLTNQAKKPIRYSGPLLAQRLIKTVSQNCLAKGMYGDLWDGSIDVKFRPFDERSKTKRGEIETGEGEEPDSEDYSVVMGP